jgi:hypothetical protein
MSVVVDGTNGLVFNDASIQNTAASGFGFKNRIINGAMVIDQRNAGAAVTPTLGAPYIVDRFNAELSLSSKLTFQQVADAPAGFYNSTKITVASNSAISATDNNTFMQLVEGYNMTDLAWGTSTAAPATVSFWIKSSVPGTYGFHVRNTGDSYCYINTYTINSANTWEYKTITIPGPTTGTWNTTNGRGALIGLIGLGTGSNFKGSLGWQSTVKTSVAGCVDFISQATGSTINITGVQLEKGSTATAFDYREYGEEQRKCYRYYFKTGGSSSAMLAIGQCFSSTGALIGVTTPQIMRATPSLTYANLALWSAGTNGLPITGLAVGGFSGNIVRLDAVVASGLVAGNATFLNAGVSSGTLELNAEL